MVNKNNGESLTENEKMRLVVNDLYKFYQFFVAKDFATPVDAPHIKELSKQLMKMYRGEFKQLGCSMPPRHKIADSTPVLTANRGWTTHGELKIGDFVFTPFGEPVEIIGVSDKSICDRLITFTDGSQILCHEGHLWTVFDKYGDINILPTNEIEKDYFKIDYAGKTRYNYHLPLINALRFTEKDLPLAPEFLGLWLGKGRDKKPAFSHMPEDNEFIKDLPYYPSKEYQNDETRLITTYYDDLNPVFEVLGLNKSKHIPEIYQQASVTQRLTLLSSLVDSIATIKKNGFIRFTLTNKQLTEDIRRLCVGLGLYPTNIQKSKLVDKSNRKQTLYHFRFKNRYDLSSIGELRQLEDYNRNKIAIKSIETVDEGELGQCIEINSRSGVYLVGEQLIPTHNSKSSMITVAFPLWMIFHNPNENILIITNSGELATKFGLQLREYFSKYGKYFNVYLSKQKQSQTYFLFEDKNGKLYNGSVRLVGVGGSITGHDASVIIIDDVYKGLREELTPSALEKMNEWYNIVVSQRIEPETKVLVLHTRWKNNDLIGMLKRTQSDDFTFVEYPAIKDDGTPLWKERYTIDILEKKREIMGYASFNAVYQQQPLDDSSDFFDPQNIRWYNPEKEILSTVRAWDIASAEATDDKNDFTSGVKMHLLPDGDVLITDMIYGKFGTGTKDTIKRTALRDGMDCHQVIETGVAGAGKLLYKEWSDQLSPYIVEQAVPVKSKVDRATPLQNAILDKKVYIDIKDKENLAALKKELNSFPVGEHDDIIDSIAHGYNYLTQSQGNKPDLIFIDL